MKLFEKTTTKVKVLATMVLSKQLTDAKNDCQKKINNPIARAKLGFVIMNFESGLKDAEKNPEINQKVIILLKEIVNWTTETITLWKNEKWEEIDYETWDELIDWVNTQAASLCTKA